MPSTPWQTPGIEREGGTASIVMQRPDVRDGFDARLIAGRTATLGEPDRAHTDLIARLRVPGEGQHGESMFLAQCRQSRSVAA